MAVDDLQFSQLQQVPWMVHPLGSALGPIFPYSLRKLGLCRDCGATAIPAQNGVRRAPSDTMFTAGCGRPAQSTPPIHTRTGRLSRCSHPLRPTARPHPSQAVLPPTSVRPQTSWFLATPRSCRQCPAGSASNSLSHRKRPAPAQHTGEQSCACPCHRVQAGHRGSSSFLAVGTEFRVTAGFSQGLPVLR